MSKIERLIKLSTAVILWSNTWILYSLKVDRWIVGVTGIVALMFFIGVTFDIGDKNG